jgi:tetratricopeptide (TPR) repeat protein
MASAGYLLMLAGFVPAIPARYQRAVAIAVPLAVVALGIRTAFRAADWADPETFFRQTIASGGFPERVSLNLAQICAGKGELKDAEAILRKTVKDYPDYPAARIQLGVNLLQQGRKAEAAQYLQLTNRAADIAAKTTPQSWHAALSLASMQFDARQPEQSLATLDSALQRYPDIWELVQYRADVLQDTKGPEAARPSVAAFAARYWWHMGARLTLARIETAAGDYADAIADCKDAETLDIHSAAPFELAAKTDVQADHLPQALAAQATAISREPAQPDQYMMLAAILKAMHQPEKAMAAARIAQQLRASGTGG